ncbi:hemocytin-like [Saccostrea echinata]|uniref:hemocytin-like n=1 Tax=Saccostrea echinata TaxID=191078 RepID=UPI002A7EEC1D|nr:hemocytin-like [Saccostrea echinata]
MERGSIPIYIGLLLWILTQTSAQSLSHVCNFTRTISQESEEKCAKFIDKVVTGWTLNQTKSFPGKTPKQINDIVRNPGDLDCFFFKVTHATSQGCCNGWISSQEGTLLCDIAHCTPSCQNGGQCTSPTDVCTCPPEYTGYRCEDKISDASSTNKFCYTDSLCSKAKVEKYYNQIVTEADCCTNGGRGWGVGSNDCSKCAVANTTTDTSVIVQTNELPFQTCLNFGPSYYRTFDGLEYEFGGMCTYTMLKDADKGWNVEVTPKNCARISECTKKVTIFLGSGETISVEAGQVKVNDVDFILTGETPKSTPDNTFTVRNMSGWIFVDSAKGVSLKVDSESTVALTIHSDKVQGDVKFQGLCGNLNRDPSDEFKTSSGTLSSSAVHFANSWQVVNSIDGRRDVAEVSFED